MEEQFFDYPNTFVTSESTTKIVGALLAFNKLIGVISKDAKNPFFRSDYAPLPTILKDIKDPMQKAGLTINHFPIGDNRLVTRLSHLSGEYFQGTFYMKSVKDTPQDRGSVITYMMRYAVGAYLGLAIDKDDDGNSGTHKPTGQKTTPPPLKKMTKVIGDTMIKYIDEGRIAQVETQLPKYNESAMKTSVKKYIVEVADLKALDDKAEPKELVKDDEDAIINSLNPKK